MCPHTATVVHSSPALHHPPPCRAVNDSSHPSHCWKYLQPFNPQHGSMHHIATIRRPWPLIPGAVTAVSHTGSEDSLVFLLPTSTASSLAFAPQQLGGMHDWRYNKRTDSCNKLSDTSTDHTCCFRQTTQFPYPVCERLSQVLRSEFVANSRARCSELME